MQKNLGRAWVGGNIGDPLINYVDEMQPDDLAILEISSFQLDQMSISPNVAAILNVTPNHLDRHGTMEAYTAAKARILDFQDKDDIAILGRDDPGAWNLRERVKGKLLSFGLSNLSVDQSGTYVSDGLYHLRDGNAYILLPIQNAIHLRGDHNRLNVLAAITIGHAAGLNLDAMLEAIDNFHGVPHRLELVRELHGVKWYNDSIATAPERTMAAIRSFDEPIVLMLGGKDKDLPWEDLAELVRERVDHVVVFGQAAEKILGALGSQKSGEKRPYSVQRCDGSAGGSPSRRRKWPSLEMSSCFRRAAQVLISLTISPNEENGLEHGYRNFRKRPQLQGIAQERKRCCACTQLRHSPAADRGSPAGAGIDHAFLSLLGFLAGRLWRPDANVQPPVAMDEPGRVWSLCPRAD